jgi:hypothetical protein
MGEGTGERKDAFRSNVAAPKPARGLLVEFDEYLGDGKHACTEQSPGMEHEKEYNVNARQLRGKARSAKGAGGKRRTLCTACRHTHIHAAMAQQTGAPFSVVPFHSRHVERPRADNRSPAGAVVPIKARNISLAAIHERTLDGGGVARCTGSPHVQTMTGAKHLLQVW